MNTSEDLIEKAILAVLSLLFAILVIAGFSIINMIFVWVAWNYLAPVFGLPILGLFQSWVLSFLCGMLFKSTVTHNHYAKQR